MKQSAIRRPGRPAGHSPSLREGLLDSASALLSDPESTDLTLQRVAAGAGVTTALAHYYFGNRDGLIAAVIDERAQPRIEELVAETGKRAANPVGALTFFVQRLSVQLETDPLLRRCLWLDAPARQLRMLLSNLASDLLGRAQHAGQLRNDLSPDYLADALLGLTLFPFLDPPGPAADRALRLTLNHVALLQNGILPAHSPRQDSSA